VFISLPKVPNSAEFLQKDRAFLPTKLKKTSTTAKTKQGIYSTTSSFVVDKYVI
jgi:hypothetical protein